MGRSELLPGVVRGGCEPRVVCNSRRVIVRARRLALLRDVAQLLLVIAVDAMFARWPMTRIPMLDRAGSVAVVAFFNALVLLHMIGSRKLPAWNARRIAATWCATERSRFATTRQWHGRQ